ncbi:MAG: prolipoprotein diacylglyceryl transferase [Acholeplasmatales bacterium]|nr:MAG: prolipoprotein diacylglyceryl transferase [Acholeplasmatales bacterium]
MLAWFLTSFDHFGIEHLANEIRITDSIAIPLYGLLIMTGVLIALVTGIHEGKKIGINPQDGIDGLLIILPLSLLGTRLWYVIFNPADFIDFLPRIIGFERDGSFTGLQGLAIHGGFLTALVATIIFTRKRKIDPFRGLDLMAPGFFVAQSLGRWGNFFNREAHGPIIGGLTNGTAELSLDAQRSFLNETLRIPGWIVDNMFFDSSRSGSPITMQANYHHPTFLYESVWNMVGFILILIMRRTKLIRSGDIIAFYLIWYSVGRFMIESLRTDSLYIWNTGLRTAQVISVLMIIGGMALLVLNRTFFDRKFYHHYLDKYRQKNNPKETTES